MFDKVWPHLMWPAVIVAAAIREIDGAMPESESKLNAAIYRKAADLAESWGSPHCDADILDLAYFFSYVKKLDTRPSVDPSVSMIVASVAGWVCDDLDATRAMARCIARIHAQHTDELEFAEVTASAVFLARTGSSKDDIYSYLCDSFPVYFTKDEVPSERRCRNREAVVGAVSCFLKCTSFEDALRTCECSNAPMETCTAIAGAIAEAYYGIPDDLMNLFADYLTRTPLHKKCAAALEEMRKPRQPHNPATAECPT